MAGAACCDFCGTLFESRLEEALAVVNANKAARRARGPNGYSRQDPEYCCGLFVCIKNMDAYFERALAKEREEAAEKQAKKDEIAKVFKLECSLAALNQEYSEHFELPSGTVDSIELDGTIYFKNVVKGSWTWFESWDLKTHELRFKDFCVNLAKAKVER